MSDSVFDQLIFLGLPLGEPLSKWPPALAVQFPASQPGAAGSIIKPFSQASPLFARQSPVASSDVNWPAYCGLLRDSGILLQAHYSEIESLSDVNVPLRMVSRAFDEGFEFVDFSSADVVLLDCVSNQAGNKCSRMPIETNGWHELKQLVETLRSVAGPGTPIGLNVLIGDVYTDVSNALAARVDFVVLQHVEPLHQSAAALDHLAWSVVAARNACIQAGSAGFPIYIDAAVTEIDHIVKLLALGATALCIDELLASALPNTPTANVQVPKGLLSGIGSLPVKATPNVEPLAAKVDELLNRIRSRVYAQHLASLSLLNREHLRALDSRAARLCAVKMLEHE